MAEGTLEPKSLLATLKSRFAVEKAEISGNVLSVTTDAKGYVEIARFLRDQGFTRCLAVSAVDWNDAGEFEVYYLVHNLTSNLYAKVATRTPRRKPKIQSLSSVWETSAMHERETWELFDIEFVGNTMLKPLFLEDWRGPPPFRKDFNWREYVAKEYYGAEGG